MKCLMELDSKRFGLTWEEKLAYLGFKFLPHAEGDNAKITLRHIFEPGMYIRGMHIPAELLFIGRPHLIGHRCELVSGRILLITEAAKTHMEAPAELFSNPGYQMCMYTKTDVVGRTYHPFDTLTVDPASFSQNTRLLEEQIFGPVADQLALG